MKYITTDTLTVLFAYGVFALSYLSNIMLSIYLNCEALNAEFNRDKFFQSLRKAVVLVLGTVMLVVAIDISVAFFGTYVPEMGEELKSIATAIAVIATIGRAAIKYLVEAYETLQSILEFKRDDEAS